MGNANSYAEPKRLLLGLGDLFINNEFVGVLKGSVVFTPSVGFAYQRPGNLLADLKGARISEDVMLEAEVCDLKLSQLRRALGYNDSLVSGTAVAIRAREQKTLVTTTTPVTTAETAIAGTREVWKMDRSTKYISGTDYSATLTTLTRKSGGAITASQTVLVEYNFSDSGSKSLKAGGELTAPNEFLVQFVHTMSSGKRIQIELWRAQVNTDFSLAFNEMQSGNFTTHNIRFKALVDTTKSDGQNLYRITEEDGPAVA